MSRYDEPEPLGEPWFDDVAGERDDRYTAITQEYQDKVISELEANIDEFLEFKSFRSLIKLVAERA